MLRKVVIGEKVVSDKRGIAWGIITLILCLFVFSLAYLLTYHFIFVDARSAFNLAQVPADVLSTFDNNWNLLPYVVFGGIGLWFIAYVIRKTGRWL